MTTRDYALIPRDGFFFNSAKGWYTAASGRAAALEWPFPSTIRGALRTACGRAEETKSNARFTAVDWETKTADVRINLCLPLCRRFAEDWNTQHLMWPSPTDAISFDVCDDVIPLRPKKPVVPTLGIIDDAREQLWRPMVENRSKPEPVTKWWTHGELLDWLCGKPLKKPGFLERESRTLPLRLEPHVTVDSNTFAAEEGGLFCLMIRETLVRQKGAVCEWGIMVRAEMGSLIPESTVTLGGDRRLARLENTDFGLSTLPPALETAFSEGSKGLRVLCVSPAHFRKGWLPDGFEHSEDGGSFIGTLPGLGDSVVLRAAYVSRPEHVSGWDMARGNGKGEPKPTLRLVPAGAVYFFTKQNGDAFTVNDAAALWLAAWGHENSQGFGCVVPGVWSPED